MSYVLGVTKFAVLILVNGLPFLCPSGTRHAGFWRNSGFVLSGAEQRSFSLYCRRGLEDMYKADYARCFSQWCRAEVFSFYCRRGLVDMYKADSARCFSKSSVCMLTYLNAFYILSAFESPNCMCVLFDSSHRLALVASLYISCPACFFGV